MRRTFACSQAAMVAAAHVPNASRRKRRGVKREPLAPDRSPIAVI